MIDIIYIDMDGVLCDFEQALAPYVRARVIETATYHVRNPNARPAMDSWRVNKWLGELKDDGFDFKKCNAETLAGHWGRNMAMSFVKRDDSFWALLKPTHHGQALLCLLRNFDLFSKVIVLTSPLFHEHEMCEYGKRLWLRTHCFGFEIPIIFDDDKVRYADEQSVLIDEKQKNCEAFERNGGKAIWWTGCRQNFIDLLELDT